MNASLSKRFIGTLEAEEKRRTLFSLFISITMAGMMGELKEAVAMRRLTGLSPGRRFILRSVAKARADKDVPVPSNRH
ncbi:hypothetical protein MHYP_G00325400 [Metynnis hypsauchen]